MAKSFKGKVIQTKMNGTVVVEITTKKPHPLYRKLITRSKTFKVDSKGSAVTVGDEVTIQETRPISKGKHFILVNTKNKKQKEEVRNDTA